MQDFAFFEESQSNLQGRLVAYCKPRRHGKRKAGQTHKMMERLIWNGKKRELAP